MAMKSLGSLCLFIDSVVAIGRQSNFHQYCMLLFRGVMNHDRSISKARIPK